jgi:small multidrug resistance pump
MLKTGLVSPPLQFSLAMARIERPSGRRPPCPASKIHPVMNETALALVVTIVFSMIGVLGDYFLKLASEQPSALRTASFYIGFSLYASTAFGWVFVMKHLKLATIGVVYSVAMILLLTSIGVIFFRESLNYYEIAGLLMAIGSLVLLMRFS